MEVPRKGGRLITYSRHKRRLQADDSHAIKRRRVVPDASCSDRANGSVEDVSERVDRSSPPLESRPGSIIFSDENAPPSTPPSSPPCSPPKRASNINVARSMHVDTPPESRNTTASVISRSLPSKAKETRPRKALVQMQLNLGQSFQKRCRTCGMEYVPSNPEDLELHRRYHSQNVDGVTISKDFLKKAEGWRGIEWTGRDGRDRIVSISQRAQCRAGRSHVLPVLRVVQLELGAVDIPDNLLWSLCDTKLSVVDGCMDSECGSEAGSGSRECSYQRYKMYLYLHDSKCVGLCLVERVAKAYKVLREDPGDAAVEFKAQDGTMARLDGEAPATITSKGAGPDRPISVSQTTYDNWMGISRIWVSSGYRKAGIASTLLDTARRRFRENVVTPKHLVAFSQPTESGARLAKKWFGADFGWHVYADSKTIMECKNGEWYSKREDERDEVVL